MTDLAVFWMCLTVIVLALIAVWKPDELIRLWAGFWRHGPFA